MMESHVHPPSGLLEGEPAEHAKEQDLSERLEATERLLEHLRLVVTSLLNDNGWLCGEVKKLAELARESLDGQKELARAIFPSVAPPAPRLRSVPRGATRDAEDGASLAVERGRVPCALLRPEERESDQ